MPSFFKACLIAPAFLAVARAQGVILSAQGGNGPASLPLQGKPECSVLRGSCRLLST